MTKPALKPNAIANCQAALVVLVVPMAIILLTACGTRAQAEANKIVEPCVVEVQKWRQDKWKRYKTLTLDQLPGFKPIAIELSRYGGRMDRRETPTGYFHVKKIDGRWNFIDPEGYHYLNMAVNSATPNDDNRDSKEAFAKRFGTPEQWAKETEQLFKRLGFTGLGCWSDYELFKQAGTPMPYVRRWNMIASYAKSLNLTHAKYGHTGFNNEVLPVFDPAFRTFLHETMGAAIAATRDDPYLIGHFSDNELPLKEKGIIQRYLTAHEGSHSRQTALDWLVQQSKSDSEITREDDRAFAHLVTETYYRICNEVLKHHDPNHLYLGSRIHGGVTTQDVTYEACGPHVDVVSVNLYHRWSPYQDHLDRWAELSGRPILITEYYAKGVDAGLPTEYGAGFAVKTQADRGRFYENFAMGLLANDNVIGWNWHRYIDDGPLDHKDQASNKGIVDVSFNEWKPLTRSIQAINTSVYSLQDYVQALPAGSVPTEPTLVP